MKTIKVTAEDAAFFEDGLLKHIANMTLQQIQESKEQVRISTAMIKKYSMIKKNLLVILMIIVIVAVASWFICPNLSILCMTSFLIVLVKYIKTAKEQRFQLLIKCLLEDVIQKYLQCNYGIKKDEKQQNS